MKIKVQNMTGRSAHEVPNQFEIYTDDGKYFQSYSSVIAFKPNFATKTRVQLDKNKHDYSRTTVKYRNQFLGMTSKEVDKAIEDGRIELVDLNNWGIK